MIWQDLVKGKPFRLYRLMHNILGCQMGADVNLAQITLAQWRLARAGIPTHIVAEWITFGDKEK
jgi:hypothetical protein